MSESYRVSVKTAHGEASVEVVAGPERLMVTVWAPVQRGTTSDVMQLWYVLPERRWKLYATPAGRFGLGVSPRELLQKVSARLRELRREMEGERCIL
jgi:hypothetical protein